MKAVFVEEKKCECIAHKIINAFHEAKKSGKEIDHILISREEANILADSSGLSKDKTFRDKHFSMRNYVGDTDGTLVPFEVEKLDTAKKA